MPDPDRSRTLIAVLGPTASGKTDLALFLAAYFDTEILSADSRQFYRGLDIGTAKPTPVQRREVVHHFIDVLDVDEPYSAGRFEDDALQRLDALFRTRDHAVLVGGSGLYVNAVLHGIDPFPDIPEEVRQQVVDWYRTDGIETLRSELKARDPKHYVEVDLDNPRRLMRALEVCLTTDASYSDLRTAQPAERTFRTIKVALHHERPALYAHIEQRVDEMLAAGLVDEARALWPHRRERALETIGYRELFAHFAGEYDLEEAVRLIKRNTRRYAKRQLTWLRNDPDLHWFTAGTPPVEIAAGIERWIEEDADRADQ